MQSVAEWIGTAETIASIAQVQVSIPAWLLLLQCLAPGVLVLLVRSSPAFVALTFLGLSLAAIGSGLLPPGVDRVLAAAVTAAIVTSWWLVHSLLLRERRRASADVIGAVESVRYRIDAFLDAIDNRALHDAGEQQALPELSPKVHDVDHGSFARTRSAAG